MSKFIHRNPCTTNFLDIVGAHDVKKNCTRERIFEVQQGSADYVSIIIKNEKRHIEAPSTTMKCPMELKMRRDLPGNIPNSELTIFTASDTFIRTPGSLRWLPPSSKN